MKRVAKLVMLAAIGCAAWLRAQPVAPVVLFEEDDPLGADYYDASIGRSRAPSELRLTATTGDKLPINTNSRTGKAAVSLEWRSEAGGEWSVLLFHPGFAAKDLSQHDRLTMYVNGPAAVAAPSLPKLALELGGERFTQSVNFGDFLTEGLDGESSTWEAVSIPLSAFAGAEDLRRVRAVRFEQGDAAQVGVLWIDDARFEAAEPLLVARPPTPRGLVARVGDRSMTLHWEAPQLPTAPRFMVFRRDDPARPFQQASEGLTIASFSDTSVRNGTRYEYAVQALNEAGQSELSMPVLVQPRAFASDEDFLEYVQQTAFDYFWFEASPRTGLVRDRSQAWSPASIAATGFGLTALCIGAERGWVSREAAADRVALTLRTLLNGRQGPEAGGTTGHKGWFYHFVDIETGERFGSSELSSIDTALLIAGALDAAMFFDRAEVEREREIRFAAGELYARIDWQWMLNGGETLSMGWHPESGFLAARWRGYNEASILYLLGLGARNKPLSPAHWTAWTSTYQWATNLGFAFVQFPPLFGHQYSALWIDFRNMADEYMRGRGMTYFENSRRATLAQQAYAAANPLQHRGYSSTVWGFTACDGPGSGGFLSYSARGAPPAENDDGTIAPTAAGGSLPFAPAECLMALRTMYELYREKIWCGYGFRDAFNLKADWWGEDVLGIDQGPILIMAENYRTGSVWQRMKRNPEIQRGLSAAGFR